MANVAVVGLGKVGLPMACHLAGIGHTVRGFDVDENLRTKLRNGINPLPFELGVDLHSFTHVETLDEAVQGTDGVFICVPTPEGEGRLSATHVMDVIANLRALEYQGVVVVTSTLDPRDADKVCDGSHVVYMPPLIRLGHVREDLADQPFIFLGSWPEQKEAADKAIALWRCGALTKLVRSDPVTVATAKLAINASLSMRVAWANDVAEHARAFGADVRTVMRALQLDPRIGPAYMNEGWPPGGPCLPRDLDVWSGVEGIIAPMTPMVAASHVLTRARVMERMTKWVKGVTPSPVPSVLVLGITYNPLAMDTTLSLGLEALRTGLVMGWRMRVFDPAMPHMAALRATYGHLEAQNPQLAASEADCILRCTNWPEFSRLTLTKPVLDLTWGGD